MKNLLKNLTMTIKTFLVLGVLSLNVGSYGDDTEILFSSVSSSLVINDKSNLLLALEMSISMSERLFSDTSRTQNGGVFLNSSSSLANQQNDQSRVAYGFQGSPDGVPMTQGSVTRLRFAPHNIPRNSTIVSASIQFRSASNASGGARYQVYAEAVDSAGILASTTNLTQTITAASNGTFFQSINLYRGDDWNVTSNWRIGEAGPNQRVDVTEVLQRVVTRKNYGVNLGQTSNTAGIGNVAFQLFGASGSRSIKGYDASNVFNNMTLNVKYAKSKVQIMHDTLETVLTDTPGDFRIGLTEYGRVREENLGIEKRRHYSISGVAFPVTDINELVSAVIPTVADLYGLPDIAASTTVREYITDIIHSWGLQGNDAATVDSLYEAALYLRGEEVHYGQSTPTTNGAHPSTYAGPVITTNMKLVGRDRTTTPKYNSPINSGCQANYIVLLSDGVPSYTINGGLQANNQPDLPGPLANIRSTRPGPEGKLADALPACKNPAGIQAAGKCGAELTDYIATNDNISSPTSAFLQGQEGDQFIETFVINFGTGTDTDVDTYFKSLATYDDGDASTNNDGYFKADTATELNASFRSIVDAVTNSGGISSSNNASQNNTLASGTVGYSVSVSNPLEHETDVYIPVFEPVNTARFSGNLKKFRIIDVNGARVIQGKNSQIATDDSGNFTANASDYWSDASSNSPDGMSAEKGGAASQLTDPNARKIYTNLSGDSNVTFTSTSTNRLSVANVTNNTITNSALGLPTGATEEDRTKIVNFMLGWENGDATSEARLYMGNMLHSKPHVVTYNPGTSALTRVQYVFAGTSEGYLHAFDASTGEENFAFIPEELLAKLAQHQYLNVGSRADHRYGIDGEITTEVSRNAAGVATKVVLYFGLRRGGNSFYALDVTNIDSPKLLWKQGKPETASASALDFMGQSWSTPYLAKVGVGSSGTVTNAVLVSGGYDEDEDRDLNDGSGELDETQIGTRVTADEGNNIYVLDADTGAVLWSLPSSMRSMLSSSIPGGLRALDTNYNGLIDRVYFADTGGDVWRLDLSETLSNSGTSSVLTKLASLGGTNASNRMFFNEPDVTTLKLNGRSVFGIGIGSGYRAHPLDETIDDKFFYLLDESPYAPLDSSYQAITISELSTISITNSGATQAGSITDFASNGTTDSRGWAVDLPNAGEKVLAASIAFRGSILFTSSIPAVSTATVGQCDISSNQSRIYAFSAITGKATLDFNESGAIEDSDISSITGSNIPSKPKLIFNTPSCKDILNASGAATGEQSCTQEVDVRVGNKSQSVANYDASDLESVYWSNPVQ